ncbi:Kinesin-like protein [Spironucleus salmonicida]|uniref:Kinesin-like protein n=2 Tax=Spironucleus salmonicida TaxID=348837 RepID=V6LTC5_9EUKA|nr:Kinesin-like protein [Spironucleus salmonicida]|eukprot:EST46946.1 Kinesin-2 [Spironucleus salmonicida]
MTEENVKVIVRVRPFSQKEQDEGSTNVISMDKTLSKVTATHPVTKKITPYTFDAVYDAQSKQTDVFDESVFPLISSVMEGYNATVFAYGQTGSGKTFTMMGYANDGVIPQAIIRIFDCVSDANNDQRYLIRAAFYEIYNEEIRDLTTNQRNLQVRTNPKSGVFIENLTFHPVSTTRQISLLMEAGNAQRTTAATKMNATSSRSHSVFQIIVECEENGKIRMGKLNLVDLAGSERAEKTGATGARLQEGAKINLSLSTLGLVISKLVEKSPHVPYRDSKLTYLLQDSLGGNAKTLMVSAISPASTNFDETASTLRYANNAKKIKNRAKVNEDPKDAQIREMGDLIKKLESELLDFMAESGVETGGVENENENEIQKLTKIIKKKKTIKSDVKGDIEKQEKELSELQMELQKRTEKQQKMREKSELLKAEIERQKAGIIDKNSIQSQIDSQQKELREAREELAVQKLAEKELKKKLFEDQNRLQEEVENENSIANLVGSQSRKLVKYGKIWSEKAEYLEEIRNNFASEMEGQNENLEGAIIDYERIKIIVEQFVPQKFLDAILDAAKWDEAEGVWVIPGAEWAGNHVRGV